MIICNKDITTIDGSIIDMVQDTANILMNVRSSLQNVVTDEAADEVIALTGRIAFAEEDEERQAISCQVIDALMRGRR